MQKTNKSIAGYHLLMLLSAVDYKFHTQEEKVIQEYLEEEFPFPMNFDREMEVISSLKPSEWKDHFAFQAQCFLEDSNLEERVQFVEFAKKLVKADNLITKQEHDYINLLNKIWNNN